MQVRQPLPLQQQQQLRTLTCRSGGSHRARVQVAPRGCSARAARANMHRAAPVFKAPGTNSFLQLVKSSPEMFAAHAQGLVVECV